MEDAAVVFASCPVCCSLMRASLVDDHLDECLTFRFLELEEDDSESALEKAQLRQKQWAMVVDRLAARFAEFGGADFVRVIRAVVEEKNVRVSAHTMEVLVEKMSKGNGERIRDLAVEIVRDFRGHEFEDPPEWLGKTVTMKFGRKRARKESLESCDVKDAFILQDFLAFCFLHNFAKVQKNREEWGTRLRIKKTWIFKVLAPLSKKDKEIIMRWRSQVEDSIRQMPLEDLKYCDMRLRAKAFLNLLDLVKKNPM